MVVTDVEKTITYAGTAASVADAFGFVMDHLDEFTEPTIAIRPFRTLHVDGDASLPLRFEPSDGPEEWVLEFEVSISGKEA